MARRVLFREALSFARTSTDFVKTLQNEKMPLDSLWVSVMIKLPCKYASPMFAWVSFGQLIGSASGRPEGALIN
jgi:hypothetical protein